MEQSAAGKWDLPVSFWLQFGVLFTVMTCDLSGPFVVVLRDGHGSSLEPRLFSGGTRLKAPQRLARYFSLPKLIGMSSHSLTSVVLALTGISMVRRVLSISRIQAWLVKEVRSCEKIGRDAVQSNGMMSTAVA